MQKIGETDKLLLGITGASGMLYVKALLNELDGTGVVVHGICSAAGKKVLATEQGVTFDQLPLVSHWYDEDDFAAAPASGSSDFRAMIILPCTMGTLGAVAGGLSMNLIHRSADVMLKERRQLILAVRETPLNRTHLNNMLKVHDAGAVICPPMPGYYLKPETLEEAAQTWAWKVGDLLGIRMAGRKRWGEVRI